MNRLKYSRGYLCGAMDRVHDGGEGWRVDLQRSLSDLEIFWLDPTHKPIDIGVEDQALRDEINRAKSIGQYDEIVDPIKAIRNVDLRMVDISDFIVVNLDMDIHACGTYEELFLANREKKPVIVRIEQGKQFIPNWLFAALPHAMFFDSFVEVGDYLRHVAQAQCVHHFKRWMFFNFDLCRKFDTESGTRIPDSTTILNPGS